MKAPRKVRGNWFSTLMLGPKLAEPEECRMGHFRLELKRLDIGDAVRAITL